MKSVTLNAYPRTFTKRDGLKKVRKNARVPAVIYGRHHEPQNLEIGQKEMEDLIHHSASENILVDLTIADGGTPKRLALVQEIQHHPLSGKILHIDLHEIVETEQVIVTVPVETVGEAVGVKTDGGVLEHVLFRLKVRSLPKDLPEFIQVDVSELKIGQSVHIGDITPPENVEILGDKKIVVLSVAQPRTEAQEAEEEAAAASAAPTEPEMIKEKKEEGAAPEAGKAPAKSAEKAPEKTEKKPEKKK